MNDLLILVRQLEEAQKEHLRVKRAGMVEPEDEWLGFVRSIGGFDPAR